MNRTNVYARLVKLNQQENQTVTTFGTFFSARNNENPVGFMRQRCPDFLTIYHPVITLKAGFCLNIRKVRAGIWLRITLTPKFSAIFNAGQEALFLSLCSIGQDSWRHQCFAYMTCTTWSTMAGILFVKLDKVHQT